MKRSLMVVGTMALFVAGTAFGAVAKDDIELDALGGWTTINSDGGDDLDILFLTARVGYFVTENIRVGGVAGWATIDMGTSGDIDLYGVGVSGKFHFMPDKQWVPYVGGQFMWGSADMGGSDTDGYIYGPVAGIRYEVTPVSDVFVEAWWQWFGGDLDDAMDDMIMIMGGIVHQLR